MKTMLPLIGLAFLLMACRTPTTYNTLFTAEKTTMAAYDGYLDLVLAGKVRTNDVPTVSKAFNDFQVTFQGALAVAQFNTNAPATADVLAAQAKVNTTIAGAKGGKK